MYVNTISKINQNQQFMNVDFKAKKVVTKAIAPEKVLDTMALMAAPLAAAGITIKQKEKTSTSNKMSNTEFRTLRADIEEKLKSYNIKLNNNYDKQEYKITKNNVILISKLLDNPIFTESDSRDKFSTLWLAESCKSKEEQDAKVKFLEVVGKDSKLLDIKEISTFIYKGIKTQQDTENIVQVYDYVTKNENLYNYLIDNSDKYKGYNDRYSFSDLYGDVKSNIKLLPQIMEDEKLKDNFKLLIRTPYYKDENYEQVLKTFSNKKELLSNENIIERLETDGSFVMNASSLNKILNIEDVNVINNLLKACEKMSEYGIGIAEFRKYHSILNTLLNTKELYKNKDISENFDKIIEIKPKSEQITSTVITIIEKIDSSEKLNKNQELMNNIGKILASIDTNEKCQKVLDALEMIENA